MIKLIKESQTIEEGIEKDKFGDNYYKFEEFLRNDIFLMFDDVKNIYKTI